VTTSSSYNHKTCPNHGGALHAGKNGSWLKARIYEAIKELNGADAKWPTVDQVLTRLPEVTGKALWEKNDRLAL
jgi:hypothetical protein